MYNKLMIPVDIGSMQPDSIRDFKEFQEIAKVEDFNFNRVREQLLEMFSMRFVSFTDIVGIKRWEKMLGLRPLHNDSLETRRMRILAKINNRLPYTWRTLQQLLNSMYGEGNYILTLDPINYEIELLVPFSDGTYQELINILDPIIPMNIWYTFAEGLLEEIIVLYDGAYAWKLNGKVTGQFGTAPKPGAIQNSPVKLVSGSYEWELVAPITGEFKAGEE